MPASRSRRRPRGRSPAARNRSAVRSPDVSRPVARAPGAVGRSAGPVRTGTIPGRALQVSGILTALDGVAAALYGVWLLVALVIRPRGTAVGVGIFGGVLLAVFGAGIVLAGRSLWRGHRRGRAPALVTHVLLLFIVPSLLAGGSWWLAVPITAVSVGALVGLFLPASVRQLAGQGAGTGGRVSPTVAPPAGRARRR